MIIESSIELTVKQNTDPKTVNIYSFFFLGYSFSLLYLIYAFSLQNIGFCI